MTVTEMMNLVAGCMRVEERCKGNSISHNALLLLLLLLIIIIIIITTNTERVECENKGDTYKNRDNWNHLKIIQKMPEQNNGKT